MSLFMLVIVNMMLMQRRGFFISRPCTVSEGCSWIERSRGRGEIGGLKMLMERGLVREWHPSSLRGARGTETMLRKTLRLLRDEDWHLRWHWLEICRAILVVDIPNFKVLLLIKLMLWMIEWWRDKLRLGLEQILLI
jgi:hypothetical protein